MKKEITEDENFASELVYYFRELKKYEIYREINAIITLSKNSEIIYKTTLGIINRAKSNKL